jgi:hypothetical protein
VLELLCTDHVYMEGSEVEETWACFLSTLVSETWAYGWPYQMCLDLTQWHSSFVNPAEPRNSEKFVVMLALGSRSWREGHV